jgi:hypothetical protein
MSNRKLCAFSLCPDNAGKMTEPLCRSNLATCVVMYISYAKFVHFFWEDVGGLAEHPPTECPSYIPTNMLRPHNFFP